MAEVTYWPCPNGHHLTLDDVLAWAEENRRDYENPLDKGWAQDNGIALGVLADEVRRLQVSHRRYEALRKLNAQQFADLYRRSITDDIAFDALVDQLSGPPA